MCRFRKELNKDKITILKNMKDHALLGQSKISQEQAAQIFEEEYGQTLKKQIKSIEAYFGESISEIPASKYRFINQAFIDVKKIIIANPTITKLDPSNKQRHRLPKALSKLENLEDLDIKYNNLSTLPSWIGELSSLKKLDCKRNDLNELPDSLSQLTNLTYIDCSNNNTPFTTGINLIEINK